MRIKLNIVYIAVALAAAAAIGLAYMAYAGAPAQTVEEGDTIKVDYTGTLLDGTQFDTSVGRAPLEFKVGSGQLIPGFDRGVIGMKLNEEKTVTIPPSDAYGEKLQRLIVEIPLSGFGGSVPQAGASISMNSSGQALQGTVTQVNSTTATVDFNSPLAGQTLVFKIKVLEITKGSG